MALSPLLSRWFSQSKRDLPWRKAISSYGVWVSEVMLQQTQVATVIPYYERWMSRFPTLKHLALADEREVLKLWEGLGYYSRARRLHLAAQKLHERGVEEMPNEYEELLKLPGIGEYTAGAIMSFAWKKPTPAIDGNVIRVITRLFGIDSDIQEKQTQEQIREKVSAMLSHKGALVLMESLIEFGALVCKKQPFCHDCPLKNQCVAFSQGVVMELPKKKPRKSVIKLHRLVPILLYKGQVALKKRGKGEVMEGLYEFPFIEMEGKESCEEACALFAETKCLTNVRHTRLQEVSHHFTRYKATLYPVLFFLKEEVDQGTFFSAQEVEALSFSSGHKKLWTQVTNFL